MAFLAEGQETAVIRDVALGHEDGVIDARLDAATVTVSGVVDGPNGPLSEVGVAAADAGGVPFAWATTDADGAFSLMTLPPGAYSVTVSGRGYQARAPLPLVVAAGESVADFDVTLVPVGVSDAEITVDLYRFAHPPIGDLLKPPEKGWIVEQRDIDNEFNEQPLVLEHCRERIEKAQALEDKAYDLFDQLSARHDADRRQLSVIVAVNSAISLSFSHLERAVAELLRGSTDIDYHLRQKTERDLAAARQALARMQQGLGHGNYGRATVDLRRAESATERLKKRLRDTLSWSEEAGLDASLTDYLRILDTYLWGTDYIWELDDYADTVRKMQEAFRTMNDCVEYYARCVPHGRLRSSPGQDLPDYCTDANPAQLDDGDVLASAEFGSVGSFDPNDKLGPAGFGTQGFVQPGVLQYEILFENDPDLGATIPAQEVFVTDPLDADLDLSTLEVTAFGFDNRTFSVPPGLAHYETTIDLRPEGIDLLVPVELDVDMKTRTLAATFRSLDPLTGQLPDDVDAGFLPVNDKELHNGEGFFSYLVQPHEVLTSGTVITNQARIVFDVNAPIDTPVTTHTLDVLGPSSSVGPLPAESAPGFVVTWQGQDDPGGSGIALYEIYVSEDGGPYTRWLTTTASSAAYPGGSGSTCSFYSIAVDGVGHREAAPEEPDATTFVLSRIYLPLVWRE